MLSTAEHRRTEEHGAPANASVSRTASLEARGSAGSAAPVQTHSSTSGGTPLPTARGSTERALERQRLRRLHQFEVVCSRLGISEDACNDWMATSDFPSACLLSFCAALVAAILCRSIVFIIGAMPLTFPHREHVKAIAAINIGALVALGAVTWTYGPNFTRQNPWLGFPIAVGNVGLVAYLTLPALVAAERRLPFANRFAFLVAVSASTLFDAALAMTTLCASDRGPHEAPLSRVLLRAAAHVLRASDAFSDIMFLRIVWEKVRPRLRLACRRSCQWCHD